MWYVLYSFLVGTVRYGTVHVLYLSVCSTTHHYYRRITEKKKKKGKKEAERCFRFLASCPHSAEFMETLMHERFGVCGWYYTVLLSVHIRAYRCSVVTMPSLHICIYVYIPRWMYISIKDPLCIHPFMYYDITHTYIHYTSPYPPYIPNVTYLDRYICTLPAYQPTNQTFPPGRPSV